MLYIVSSFSRVKEFISELKMMLKSMYCTLLRAVLTPKIDFPYPKTSSLTYHMLNSDEQLKKGAS